MSNYHFLVKEDKNPMSENTAYYFCNPDGYAKCLFGDLDTAIEFLSAIGYKHFEVYNSVSIDVY